MLPFVYPLLFSVIEESNAMGQPVLPPTSPICYKMLYIPMLYLFSQYFNFAL